MGVRGSNCEMDDRKEGEERILKSKGMLQTVFDGIPEPLIMIDRNLTIEMLNKSANLESI